MSERWATVNAAARLAPVDMPPGMPSTFESIRDISNAISLGTVTTSSIIDRSSTVGMNPAPMPWILCGPRGWPDRIALVEGSTAMILIFGLRALSTRPQPVIVPPVPTPTTSASILPCVSFQISSAVVFSCTSGFAGLSNWPGITASGSVLASSSARATAAGMPPGPGVSSSSAPRCASILRRSIDIVSGITRIRR